jgi:WD40 repeat protein
MHVLRLLLLTLTMLTLLLLLLHNTQAGETLTLASLATKGGWVYGVKWASGHHLASCSKDGAVRLWDIRCAAPLRSLPAHAGTATATGITYSLACMLCLLLVVKRR